MIKLSNSLPSSGIATGSEKYIKFISKNADIGKYMTLVLISSLIISLLTFFSGWPLYLSFLTFAITAYILNALPKYEYKTRLKEMELELPFYLKNLSVLFNMNVSFEKALLLAAQGTFSKMIINSANENNIPLALTNFCSKLDSIILKRGIYQIISLYETGDARNLEKTADDILQLQKHEFIIGAGKASIFGLIYTSFSTITPTMLLIYASLSTIIGYSVDQFTISTAMLILIPGIDLFLLLMLCASVPRFFSKNQIFDLRMIILSIIVLTVGVTFDAYLIPLLIILIFYYSLKIYQEYKIESKIKEIEEALPDAFFALSGLPKGSSIESYLKAMLNSGSKSLRSEVSVWIEKYKTNIPLEKSIVLFNKQYSSPIIDRFCFLLLNTINTSSFERTSELATDMLGFFEINRERAQLFSVQRYTLIMGAVAIPVIINLSLKLISGLNFNDINLAKNLIIGYLVLYSVISSIFLNYTSTRPTLYGPLMLAMGLITFYLSNIFL